MNRTVMTSFVASAAPLLVSLVPLVSACAGDGSRAAPPAQLPAGASAGANARDAGADARESGVTVYLNGKIYTAVDGPQRWAQAIAVRGPSIVRVGSTDDVRKAFPSARSIDLRGRVVTPGFNDAHFHHHPDPKGVTLRFESMEPSRSQVVEAIKAEAAKKHGQWIFADVGAEVIEDPTINRASLDAIAPENPVYLRAFYGHGHVLDSKAFTALGIVDDVKDPRGGRFLRTKTGKLEGHVYEYAEWITSRRLADLVSDAELAGALATLAGEAGGWGVTSLQVMSWSPAERYLRAAAATKALPRVRWINWPAAPSEAVLPRRSDGRVTVGGIKWILDGTPYERGAAMSFPWADTKKTQAPNFAQADVVEFFEQARRERQQLLLHAAGDVPVDLALAAAARVPADELTTLRPRIEHGDWIRPEHDEALKKRSFVVVQNPTHLTMVDLFEKRWGKARVALRLGSLVRGGIHVALGSDGPLNPFLNIMLATIHPYRGPAEALTREQAVDAYTREAAFAELAESTKGTLEAGKLADFAVLSQDIFTCPAEALPATRSVLTVIGGEAQSGSVEEL